MIVFFSICELNEEKKTDENSQNLFISSYFATLAKIYLAEWFLHTKGHANYLINEHLNMFTLNQCSVGHIVLFNYFFLKINLHDMVFKCPYKKVVVWYLILFL